MRGILKTSSLKVKDMFQSRIYHNPTEFETAHDCMCFHYRMRESNAFVIMNLMQADLISKVVIRCRSNWKECDFPIDYQIEQIRFDHSKGLPCQLISDLEIHPWRFPCIQFYQLSSIRNVCYGSLGEI